MGKKVAAPLDSLTSADPVPSSVAGLVAYTGSREAAVRALTGLAGPPQRGDYKGRDAAERYKAASTTWRSASRRVQRHTTDAGEKRGTAAKPRPVNLSTAQRRRAQAVNRQRKVAATRNRGVRANVTAVIRANSPSDRRTKQRTINGGDAGVLIRAGYIDRALAARAAGDLEAAERHLTRGFLAGAGMPSTTTVTGASWELWPDDDDGDGGRFEPWDEGEDGDEDAGEL